MNNVCASSLQHYLDQDCKVTCSELGDKSKDNCDHVEVSDQSLSTQVMNASHVSVTSFTNKTDSDSLYNQLIQDLCPEYEYIINVKTISDVCGDSFFQEHAVRYGYKFTEYFLLVMENHKSSFLEKVDYILTGLCGSFSFLKELDSQSINIIYLMNKICFSFSECVYRLRSKCISVLQSDFIPIIVKVIFGSSVIDGDCERKMTYSEMDKLFLRFVITLEKLVMAKIMKYWRDFCDKNKSLLSLIPDVDYSNPFYYACHFDVISVPDATHPAAFTYKFGEYISFLAIAKIDIMSGNFVGKCADVLKVIIRYKCTHICDCSSDAYNDIKKLVKELHVLIKKEFDRKVVEDTVRDNFTKFFSDLMIWRQQVVEAKLVEGVVPSIVELITSDMYKSLMCILHGYLYDMVRNFHPYMMVSGKIVSSGGCDYLRTIENSLGVRIHPEDSYNIVALRSKFYSKFEKVVWNKFSVMLKEKHEFSDGTVISRVGWNRISKKLFPIAHGEIRLLIDMERLELSKLLSKVRIIDDVCVFDFSSVGSREATSEEKSIIFKLAIIKSDRKSKDLFRKVWVNLIKTTEDTKVDAVSVVEDVYPSVPTALPMRLNYYSSGSRADNIVNRWELNLHPDDDKLILFIRRNFSMDIRIYLHGLFSSMMAAKTVLSSGKVLHKCSWSLVSSDLYPIAIESVKPIIKREHEELYKVLSEARVIDVGGNDKFSCVIRKVTKEEKDDLLKRAKIFICSGLRHSFRLAWLDVIKAPEVSEKCEGSLPLQSESTTDRFIATDAIYSVAHIPLLYHQLLQDLCKGYGYNYIVDIKEESEIGDDNFLISHAIKYGYCFTEDFLLALMKNKSCFLEKVESILTGLCGSFSFLGELGNKSISIVSLMDKICYSFSNSVYDLRDKCIGVLQSEFVPTIIGIIFDSSIINDDCERKMTYPEKEQLFLFFITALERLIMVRIMKYWRDFCSENESLLSLIPTIDYSDPFSCAYRYDKTNTPNIDYPAAFTIRFGECISLMAVAKIDEMMKNFVENNADVFKEVIRAKCLHICNYSSNPFVDIKKILKNLRCFIKKEFDKVVNEKIVEGHFGNFLNELIIWRRQVVEPEIVDIGKSSIIKIIVGDMCESLVRCLYDCLYDMVSSFSFHIASSWSNASKVGSYLHTIESKLEIKIHPEDGYDILSIRRNFLAKSRKVIWDKFFSMLKKKHKFSDGTVISKVDWSEISKKLFPVAQGSVRHLLDMERLELSRLLSKLRVVEDINEFNFSSSGTREATLKERNYFLKLAIGSADRQTKDLFRKVWLSLVEVPVDDKISHDTSDTLEPVDEGESSVDVMLPVELNCHSLGVGANKIINKWKLNLHPDDDKLILFIRRKFSTEMRDYLRTLFSGMLEEKAVLASGKELCNCSWTAISSELYPIAVESVGPIIENEYRELDKVLSEVRIVDVNNSDGCSYIIRKVTGEEKNSLLRLTMAFVYRELRCSARLVWLGIIKYSYNKHGYNDAGEYLNVGIEGACGIRLRYSDSVAILRTRRRFSSKIVSVICDKFSGMLENKYKFNDGTTIDRVAWFRVSRKLFPIAKGEVKHIIADERVELEEIVSGSRAVVDRTTDREITDGEKFIVLESIMKLVCNALKSLCAKVWESVIESLRGNFDDEVSNIEDVSAELSSVGNLSSSSVNFPLDAEICGASGLLGLSLCHEDDIAILNIRRKFSSCVRIRVRNKFSKMLKEKYEFEDHTIIDMSPWIRLSKKLIPIAKKEIEPIIEEQYIKIKEVLLKSRVIVSSKGYSCTTRELTSEERSSIIKIIMKSVHKQSMDAFSRVWRAVIESLGGGRYSTVGTDSVVNEANALELEADGFVKDNLLSVSLSNLREEDMAELDNVRLEFVGNLASIVDEVVNLLLSDVDMSLSIAVNVLDKVISTTAERSSVLFKEGGFHERVESVLLNAMVLEPSGNARVLEADERKYIFQIFMDSIDSDRDYLARKRAGELIGASVSALGDEHVGLLAS